MGIVLILETIKDRKYWDRLHTTIEHFDLPIETWNVGKAAFKLFAKSNAFVINSEDFESEELSLVVKNEDAIPVGLYFVSHI